MFTTFHPIANREMIKAGKRYNRQRRGLGLEFHEELELALLRIRNNPLAYAADDETGLHLCPLHRFPYSIVYGVIGDRIWIAAVAHHGRRSRYWARRRPNWE
jgi:hypothetical protein